MRVKSQISPRALRIVAVLCIIPSLVEAHAILWGATHHLTGKALRDGLDFWAGGHLALSGQLPVLINHPAYQGFLTGMYGKLPYHLWSYPPTYLLVSALFAWMPPWPAVFAFDAASLALLAGLLRLAKFEGWFIAAVLLSPASLENLMEHQNATLIAALLGGGVLLLERRPRLGGVLIGLASIKPQFGVVLPLNLLRHAPRAAAFAAASCLGLAGAAYVTFGPAAWTGFFHDTAPAMSAVLLTGKPPEFAGGLMSVFALARPLGVHPALLIQTAVTLACIIAALFTTRPACLLILAALASPYLHDYDLVGATLATALLMRDRLAHGFYPGEAVLFFLVWFGPGLLPWAPRYAHAAPLLLALLLASAWRRGGLPACDSSPVPPASPALSAGRSPIPAPPDFTASG